MNFDIPEKLQSYLDELDRFIEQEIKPLEEANDNIRFFDHRREDARTDWERNGLPNEDWEALLAQAKRVADAAGHYRYPLPEEYGGSNGTNLDMAVIREHLATKGLGLHNDLQNEHSIVGNNVGLLLMIEYGTDEQKAEWIDALAEGVLDLPLVLPNQSMVPMPRIWRPWPNATVTNGLLMAQKLGIPVFTRPNTI